MLKFLFVVVLFAVAVYLLVRVIERRGVRRPGGPEGGSGGSGGLPPRGPVGPDDDPDFLWDLDKKLRRPTQPPGDEPDATS